MFKYLFLFLLCISPALALAEDDNELPPELQGLGVYDEVLPLSSDNYAAPQTKKRPKRQHSIIPYIQTTLPKATSETVMNIIANPEQVFCYHVTKRPADYNGYTLNNFAITDFCGELDAGEIATSYEALFTQSPNIITASSACIINPKVMLRFVRGIDYADVLLSSPCPSFTVFYAGRYSAFNIKQGVIDDIISQFEKSTTSFNSPALLRQIKGNGSATTDKETELYEKKQRENAPIMNWQQEQTSEFQDTSTDSPSATETAPKKGGWGKLKLKM